MSFKSDQLKLFGIREYRLVGDPENRAGNLSYDCARGIHRTVSAAASRRHVDASLDLFARKSSRSLRDLAGKRALSARRLFLWVVGVN